MQALDQKHVDALRDLAEGRTEPRAWLVWWDANATALEATLSPGKFLAVKPRGVESNAANAAALGSQSVACKVLDQLNISYQRSEVYERAWRDDFQTLLDSKNIKHAARAAEFEPRIAALQGQFPRFAKFLRSNAIRIQEIGRSASEDELTNIESDLGIVLPAAYRNFLRCARTLIVDDVLQLTLTHPFVHRTTGSELPTDGMLCIADFSLESDGDQALIDVRAAVVADPPVLYYAHEAPGPKLRTIAQHFTKWIEGLPRVLAE